MFKIINIECKNDFFIENGSIERENTFYGQAVIDKDGYFEGLVTVPYSGIYINRLIFGVFTGENVSLYKFEPTNEGIRTRYDSYAFDDELPGSFCVSSNDEVLATGIVSISISKVLDSESMQSVVDDIMYNVDNWKQSFFDNDTKRLYEKLALEVIEEKDDKKVFEKK